MSPPTAPMVRLIAGDFKSSYVATALQTAATTDDSLGRSRLLHTLRGADAAVIPSLVPFLEDTRTADFIKWGPGKNPGLGIRVCDIAYNVIEEIEAVKKSQARQIERDADIKTRDSLIRVLAERLRHRYSDIQRNVNPYTPPAQRSDTGVVQASVLKDVATKRSNRWITIAVYCFVILGIGLAASLLASLFIPDAKLDLPSPNTTGLRAHLAIGGIMAMLVCPILAALRHWGVSNYCIASILALGLLFGNVGFGIPLSLFSLFILYGTQRLLFLLTYFRS